MAPTYYTLDKVHGAFRRWLGDDYDLDALNAVLATAAAARLTGDPLWLLLLSGSGNAKTETVQALAGAGAIVTSTIASEGALLSGVGKKEKSKDATGGLLRKLTSGGVLVVKDMTSVLSMHRDTRTALLAALREIHDQKWERNLGTDGGRTLTWAGRIAVVGAVTTAWDRAHDVIASMGDRFVVVRMDSTSGRLPAGRRAMGNTGAEDEMRRHLAEAVGAILARVDPRKSVTLTADDTDQILAAADVVTLCRTGVDYDYRGDVIDAHAPEMPTRFAKQLVQMVRGGVAIGMRQPEAVRLALRCARDSMPPIRLAILEDVAAHPGARTGDVRKRLDKPWSTVDRQLQALHILGVLTCHELDDPGKQRAIWTYHVADHIEPEAVRLPEVSPEKSHITTDTNKEEKLISTVTDISGDGFGFDYDAFGTGRPS
jgi:hypothetical protein